MKPLLVFSGATGLNTVVDPVRVRYDPETGVSDLSVGVNVTIDSSLRPSRRQGYSRKQDGNYHSLFCDGGDCFVCEGKSLFQVGHDLSVTGVRSGLSGARVSYCQIADETYYSNGSENGVIREGVSYPWPVQKHVGAETSRQFAGAPVGNHLAFFASRMFVSEGKVLWWSEPFSYGLFDLARSFILFRSEVIMVKPVSEGLYVSTRDRVSFLSGLAPHDFRSIQVTPYPAYEWSDAVDYIDASILGLDIPGLCAFWSSPEGAVIGTPTGQIVNLTKDKIVYPKTGRQGASLVRGEHVVHTIF